MSGTSDVPSPGEPLPPGPPGDELLSTLDLLERFKMGDEHAVTLLVERSIPPLRRWARGRLPVWARSLAETQDLVQTALMRALPRLKEFEARHPGALQAYLRQAVANHIRDEVRKASTRRASEVGELQPDPGPSPLEQAIGREGFERYEAALATLRPIDREAIIARVELQQSYEEVAIALDKPNANAARVAVTRAVKNLVKAMAEDAAKGRAPQV
jgi:RNA polymerase sigma factor (sigma-70 family)